MMKSYRRGGTSEEDCEKCGGKVTRWHGCNIQKDYNREACENVLIREGKFHR